MLEIVAEAELLETLGFGLPNTILTVTTQKERIHAKLDALHKMVKEYTHLIDRLDTPQVQSSLTITVVYFSGALYYVTDVICGAEAGSILIHLVLVVMF